ncbi:MAG TPA: CRISPR-associated endonuclease Cas1, partial [Prolixibacteraceae bacterium]|nr:CRISPR-associated endonuclease Cas1 [Prolixibacteraceae bacterium]
MRLLLISNSTMPGEPYLDYPKQAIKAFLGDKPVNALFIPYAAVTFSFDDYVEKVQERFSEIGHQVTVLRKFGRRQHAEETRETIHQMKQLERMLPDANTRDELMGLEGAAAKSYWPQVGRLMPEGMGFGLRSKQPPMDVPNAAFSFLYTLLLGE